MDSTIVQAIAEGEKRFAEAEKRWCEAAQKWAYGNNDGQPSTLYKKVLEAASAGHRYLNGTVDKYQAEYAAHMGLTITEMVPGQSFSVSW
jgi:hypothetical protein